MKPNYAVIIPARYGSSRFPGKPLAKLGDKEIICHVLERMKSTGHYCIVATDDERICKCVEQAGGTAVMTDINHNSGTDRVCEAMQYLPIEADIIVNVQGDEPFIHPEQIEALVGVFEEFPDTDIATLVRLLPKATPFATIADPGLVKVVTTDDNCALYFSRLPVPAQRGIPCEEWTKEYAYMVHIGVYAYRREILQQITQLPISPLEKAEKLEQLRWLQAGCKIRTVITHHTGFGIDTAEDLVKAKALLDASVKSTSIQL